VPSLARPGGNITGFSTWEFSIGGKWLEMLKEIAPTLTQVAVVFSPQTAPYAPAFLGPIEAAASSLAVELMAAPASDGAGIEAAVDAFAHSANGGLIVLPDVTTINHRDLMVALAARYRLPAIYPFRFFAASGGLMSCGASTIDPFRRAAGYVDRILKVAWPLTASTQRQGKIVTIGILAIEPWPPIDTFRRALHDLGYIEGNNVRFEYRYAKGDNKRLPELANNLVGLK
jgi:putative ABC transport system substrate-binding protein